MIGSRHGRRPYILRTLATVGVATALVGGCTSGSSSSSATGSSPATVVSSAVSVSVTPSPSPSPSPTLTPPVLPAAAKQPTQAGAEAFFRYFLETYNYAFVTLDTQPMRSICDRESKFCLGVYSDISGMQGRGERQVGGKISASVAVSSPVTANKVALVDSLVDQLGGATVSATGATVHSIEKRSGVPSKAVLMWVSTAWRLMGLEVAK